MLLQCGEAGSEPLWTPLLYRLVYYCGISIEVDRVSLFLARYVFQAAIHTVWRERNA